MISPILTSHQRRHSWPSYPTPSIAPSPQNTSYCTSTLSAAPPPTPTNNGESCIEMLADLLLSIEKKYDGQDELYEKFQKLPEPTKQMFRHLYGDKRRLDSDLQKKKLCAHWGLKNDILKLWHIESYSIKKEIMKIYNFSHIRPHITVANFLMKQSTALRSAILTSIFKLNGESIAECPHNAETISQFLLKATFKNKRADKEGLIFQPHDDGESTHTTFEPYFLDLLEDDISSIKKHSKSIFP